ncbi:hypothetical protein ACU4GD_03805 [Cupriavidus basilensis]
MRLATIWSTRPTSYADRTRKHQSGFYTSDLMVGIPKKEYLFKTVSSIMTASFGLDFGEIYKRSVIGVRRGIRPATRGLWWPTSGRRIGDDYHQRARNTEYHRKRNNCDYMLCAKTVGAAFRVGAATGPEGHRRQVLSDGWWRPPRPTSPRWR